MPLTEIKERARTGAHTRRGVVGVIGSGVSAVPECTEVGRLIAALDCHLLTGGGGGVMAAVSRAFCETSPRAGLTIGVVPGQVHGMRHLEERHDAGTVYEPPPGYPNEWVDLAIYTHLPDRGDRGAQRTSRNHINVLSADAIVALPGGEGTESEIWLARQYGVPIVAYGAYDSPPPHDLEYTPTIEALRAFLIRHLNRRR